MTTATKSPRPRLTVPVKGLKVTTMLAPGVLTPDLVPPEPAPAGEVMIGLDVAGKLTAHALVNGKSIRKALRTIAEHGTDNVILILQGNLIPGDVAGTFVLDCPGLSCQPKTPRPDKDAT
jgi:hypothetical protein